MTEPIQGEQRGAMITAGATDWQIFQQDETGHATITLRGRWRAPEGSAAGLPRVQTRVVYGDNGLVVNAMLDWQDAGTKPDGTWTITVKMVPAGGLYRIETRYLSPDQAPNVWASRGDMRHFLGVGDLWIIAGQSNAAGYGRGPVYDPPQPGVHLFRNSQRWALASHPLNDSTDSRHCVNSENSNPAHSPWLRWAKLVQGEMNFPIGLIQTSLGGSLLAPWNPTEAGGSPLWNNMKHCVQRAGGRVKGVLWHQGESETNTDDTAASYLRRFGQTVKAWRTGLKNDNLAIVSVQLNRLYGAGNDEGLMRRWTLVREQQRRAAQMIENVVVVPSLDLPLSDYIHNSPDANMLLAERTARAALDRFYGKKSHWQAPDVQSAQKIGNQQIELSFAHVSSFLASVDASAKPFYVEDQAGPVQVDSWASTDHRVRLKLGRSLHGGTMVHGGYGNDPEIVPHDESRHMPMLAFYGLEVVEPKGLRPSTPRLPRRKSARV